MTAGIFGKPKLARIFAGRTGGRYDADYLWTPCIDGEASPYCKQVPARPNDDYALFDQDVMDEVLRTVRDGVRGDGKTFSGGGRRPNLTFVNLPGVDSSGHGTGRGAVYDATVGPGRRADPALRGAAEGAAPVGSHRARAALRPLDGVDAEQELADRAVHRGGHLVG